MTVSHTTALDLLGKTVSFNDSRFEHNLNQLTLSDDYPKDLLDSFREGVVIQVCFDLEGNDFLCVSSDYPHDNEAENYLLKDMKNLKVKT